MTKPVELIGWTGGFGLRFRILARLGLGADIARIGRPIGYQEGALSTEAISLLVV